MKKLSNTANKEKKINIIIGEILDIVCYALNKVLPVFTILCSLISILLTFSLEPKDISLNPNIEDLDKIAKVSINQKIMIINSMSLLFTLIKTFTEQYVLDKQSEKSNKIISYFELNTYSQSLFNYIRLCFSPKKWNKDTERITESIIQYVLNVKNPQSKEAFLKDCLEMSEELSEYPLKHKSYACNPICKNFQLIPEEKLHSIFQEIHKILQERKENYETL